MVDVFLSRPTWVANEFKEGQRAFLNFLDTLGFKPHTLGSTDYPSSSPLDAVIDLIEICEGAIILGYPQIEVKKGAIKNKPLPRPLLLSTEWNHIEAGLVYAKRLPLLIVHHIGVVRGIFDRGVTDRFIYEVDLSKPDWPLLAPISGALKSWKSEISKRQIKNKAVGSQPESRPTCPNCSTSDRPVYLSRLASVYQKSFDATHECLQCHYREKFS